MSITINELTIEVPGNVIKTPGGDGTSKLRVTQEQAQSIYDQLGPVLAFFKGQNNETQALAEAIHDAVTGTKNTGKQVAAGLQSIPATNITGAMEAAK